MRDALAERLVSEVMDWDAGDVARERPDLQAMASYKYDSYQQFSPGMRFIESLALWLDQFEPDKRVKAYQFMKQYLVFYSEEEISHLVDAVYPDHLRPYLFERAASEMDIEWWKTAEIAKSTEFQRLRRQCLILGLSDGARLARFRRSNPELSHEQIWQTYEVPESRVQDMRSELAQSLRTIVDDNSSISDPSFETVVLLDDFTASGVSYFRKQKEEFDGKIGRFLSGLSEDGPLTEFLSDEKLAVFILIYIATTQALCRMRKFCEQIQDLSDCGFEWRVKAVHVLDERIIIGREEANRIDIDGLIDGYYDPEVYGRHAAKGGTGDLKFGFGGCGLPVVLNHNTPNNSLYILWAKDEDSVRGLFPRVSRHG